jgi:hypothetical protein
MSTLKVDTIESKTINGNITVSSPLVGSGASLTNLPAANLTGTIAGARLPDPLPAISGASLTGISGLTSRTTASATASGLANLTAANINVTAAKTCALLKIETTHAAWITLYTDGTSRTNDSTRNETTDPLPGSGVIAEIITSGAATQIITPGTLAWNNDTTPGTTIYAKVYNKSGNTADITVTLHYLQLEA